MIHKIFSVYDSKTEAYLPPFYSPARGAALRSFMDALSNPQHEFAKHSADYTLFELGSFDDSNAKFEMLKTPSSVALASELIAQAA